MIKQKMSFRSQGGGGGWKGGGLLTFGGRGGAGGVVHNRESREFRSPEVDISAAFTPSEIIQSQKTVTSVLVNDRSRVGRRNLQT